MFQACKIRSLFVAFFLLTLLLANSLNAQTNSSSEERVIVSNKKHYISYRVSGESIIFTLESIKDLSDDMHGGFPDTDFFSIDVDVNHNGKIDKDIDVGYGAMSKEDKICTQYLRDHKTSSVCGEFKSKASLVSAFKATKNNDKSHPVFEFTIPKKELDQGGNRIDVVFTCYSSGKGYTNYPDIRALDHQNIFQSFNRTWTIQL